MLQGCVVTREHRTQLGKQCQGDIYLHSGCLFRPCDNGKICLSHMTDKKISTQLYVCLSIHSLQARLNDWWPHLHWQPKGSSIRDRAVESFHCVSQQSLRRILKWKKIIWLKIKSLQYTTFSAPLIRWGTHGTRQVNFTTEKICWLFHVRETPEVEGGMEHKHKQERAKLWRGWQAAVSLFLSCICRPGVGGKEEGLRAGEDLFMEERGET